MRWILLVVLAFQTSPLLAEQNWCQEVQSKLQPADVLFVDINEFLFQKVAEATDSWTSHVGVAAFEDNNWFIYESVDPISKRTPLCEFLKRTKDNHLAIRRLKSKPTDEQLTQLYGYLKRIWASNIILVLIIVRTSSFVRSSFIKLLKSIWCRSWCHQAAEAIVGREPIGSTWFWRIYFLGFIPWERLTVTPKDQLVDNDLSTIWSWQQTESKSSLIIAK